MLEYAYRLESFHVLPGLLDSQSIEDFFERLARILAERVLARARKGLYRAYVPDYDHLPYIRGTLDVTRQARQPWTVALPCDFHEHTADLEDNQILAWTLQRIAQSGLCSERLLPVVRRAFHAVQGVAATKPFRPADCVDRLYNRLNGDYEPLHALCRFFLEHTGPTYELGRSRMVPFVVNMGRLFELFVAEWLKVHLPKRFELRYQEQVHFAHAEQLQLTIDAVLYERATGRPVCVLDAKYKVPEGPSQGDLAQIGFYADAKGCDEAALVYPTTLASPFNATVGNKRVRTLTFDLDGDLEATGRAFIGAWIRAEPPPSPL
jgi:5-methylcytosine-specific restriction enzyme subunit McrC